MKTNIRPFLFVLFVMLGFLLPTGQAERVIRPAEKNGSAEARSGKSFPGKKAPPPSGTMATGNRGLCRTESPAGVDGISPELTTPPGCTASSATFTSSTPVAISASGTPIVTSTMNLSGVGLYLYDLNVTTFISHTSNQDLDITITSPSGKVVTLTTDNGGSNNDVFNGTVWDDQVDPDTQVPYASNNNLVTDHTYSNLTVASPLVPEEPLGAFIGDNPNGNWTVAISDDTNLNGGSLNSWSLQITSLQVGPAFFTTSNFGNSTPISISSSGTPLVTSMINVSGLPASISDVDVGTFISHTNNADLDITITSPSGTVVTLATDRGETNDNVFNGTHWDDDADPGSHVPYLGNPNIASDHTYANAVLATPLTPMEPLAAFTGENPNGTWTLTISDDANLDGGSLNSWNVIIETARCPLADLAVAITDSPDPVNAGNTVTYALTVTNAGPDDTDIKVTAPVPVNTSFVSLVQTAGPVFNLTTPPVGGTGLAGGSTLSFPSGASAMFIYVVKVNLSTPNNTAVTSTASAVSLSGITFDPISANNTASTSTTVVVPPPPPLTFFAAVDSNNNLVRFNSDAPGVITSSKPIGGLLGGEQIVGLDRRPANGQLFGMGQVPNSGRLLTVDLQTGATTPIGAGFPLPQSAFVAIQGTNYGFDFNPQVDRIRVVANTGDNFRLNPNTGGIAGADTAVFSGAVTAAAYDRNFAGTPQTTLFGINIGSDQLVTIGNVNGTPSSPNTGQVFPIGPLGVDTSAVAGFDIVTEQMNNRAWAALTVDGLSGLYTVDLATGQVAFVGIIGAGLPNIRGLTVLPTPILSISDVTVTEGDGGSVNATFDVSLSAPSDQTVIVDYFTANGTATQPGDYTAVNGPLFFSPGQTLKTVTVPVNGDTLQEGDETFFVNLTNVTNAVISDAQGVGTIHDNEPAIATLSFSAVSYGGIEDCGVIVVTVNRSGNTAPTMSVRYATADGSASSRTDYTSGSGTLIFGPGDTSKSIPILISEDSHVEGTETASITLSNAQGGAVLGSPATASIVIIDDAAEAAGNPINDSTIFVCQHYHDLLNREPDPSGLAFWVNNIESCGADAGCREAKRMDTSASFFLSIEFQETGGTIERAFRAAFNRRALIAEFLPDSQQIGNGVIVGEPGYQTVIEANKVAYYDQLVGRPEFVSVFGGLSNAQFVDALNGNTGGALSGSERDALVAALDSAAKTRAQALRIVVEDPDFITSEFNRAFVTMQYFGYLRRDPDEAGFIFWLNKLNSFNGDFRRAEMVKAFISSIEYSQRFAP
jgi:subtilisin-like proprotein convertase family protein